MAFANTINSAHTNGFSGKDSRKEASISVPALEFPSLCESED